MVLFLDNLGSRVINGLLTVSSVFTGNKALYCVAQPSASRRAALSNIGLYFPVKTDETVSNPLGMLCGWREIEKESDRSYYKVCYFY